MSATLFGQLMEHIIHALEKNGYDPYKQLIGYLKTGNPAYITRQDEARTLIRQLDKSTVQRYIETRYKNSK